MPITIDHTKDELTIRLEGTLTIRNCHDVATQLNAVLKSGASVTIGTSGLMDIDTCMLQLLCSLHKSVALLSFKNPSEVFVSAIDRCGLRRELLNGTKGET